MEFDPNELAEKQQIFASYVPDRRPAFKMYTNRGHALNALVRGRPGIIYKRSDATQEWTEVARVEESLSDVSACQACGTPYKEHKYTYSTWYSGRTYVWDKKNTDNPVLMSVCYDCEKEF